MSRLQLNEVYYITIILFYNRGIDIDSSTVGIAFIGTMCNRPSATGVTQDGGRSLTSVVTTAAHELGHIFNMAHDTCRLSLVSQTPQKEYFDRDNLCEGSGLGNA